MRQPSKLSPELHRKLALLNEIHEQERKEQEERLRREQEEYARALERNRAWRRKIEIQQDSAGVFLQEEDGFCFDLKGCISSQELYEIYCDWCSREGVPPVGIRGLSWQLKHSPGRYAVLETTLTRGGRRCRGFKGIRAADVTDNLEKNITEPADDTV